MIEKKIIVCTGTDNAKNIRIRLSLLLIEDGNIISQNYHSVAVEPDADLDMIRSSLEIHLADKYGGIPGAPWPTIPNEEWNEAVAHCAIVFTPMRVNLTKQRKLEAANAATITTPKKG